MSAHTPGPWKLCAAKDSTCSCRQIWSGDGMANLMTARQMIGCVHQEWGDGPGMVYGGISEEESLANARLIAAAPDLLSLMERFVSEAGNHNEDLADARALLAKVRG